MGRPRTPTSILEAKGAFKHNPDRGRARENEPVPAGPLGDPPERLPEEQKVVWRELASEIPEGVLTVADRQLMEIFCSLCQGRREREPGLAEIAEKDRGRRASSVTLSGPSEGGGDQRASRLLSVDSSFYKASPSASNKLLNQRFHELTLI